MAIHYMPWYLFQSMASRYYSKGSRKKFVGITGLFLGMLLTLPFGYSVLQDVTQNPFLPPPGQAFVIGGIAGSVSLVVILGLVKAGILSWGLSILGRFTPKKCNLRSI